MGAMRPPQFWRAGATLIILLVAVCAHHLLSTAARIIDDPQPPGVIMTVSLRTLELRVRALETRLAELEGGAVDLNPAPRSQLTRDVTEIRLTLALLLEAAGLQGPTDEEVDAASAARALQD